MNIKPRNLLHLLITVIVLALLAACGSTPETTENPDSVNPVGEEVTLAMVDSVTVEQRGNHYYAVVAGNYPDSCTSISSVEQIVAGDTISITLLTDKPADLMCAMVLTPFTADILLTTGGLMPAEYSVVVNEGPSATFSLE